MQIISKALAEMAGTFAIIFVGAGSIVISEKYSPFIPPWVVPVAWGLVICLMIVAMGPISGAHFNPAVTLAFTLAKKLPLSQLWIYWLSQFIGGAMAITILGALQKI